jgi:imidazolonepropionase-like amidohydrolase
MSAGYVKTLEEAMDWWLSPAGDTMIAHMARTHVVVTPTLAAYLSFLQMARNQEEWDGRMRVYNVQKELTRRFHKAGIVILAGSDFGPVDKGVPPGTSLLYEMRALAESGLTPDEVSRAAGANIIAWLQSQPGK